MDLNEPDLVWLRRVEATFTPKRVDDLREGDSRYIGQRFVFNYCWLVNEEDGGPYVGQTIWMTDGVGPWGWVPSEDLSDAVLVE